MRYRRGETVIFVVGDTPHRGMITEKNGDMYVIIQGGVMGTNTRNSNLRAVVGGTRHEVHMSMIMRKTG